MSDGIHYSDEHREATLGSPFHSNVLKGKSVLITGGGSGIGLQIALQMGLHGARIAIMGRTLEKLNKAKAYLKSEGVGRVLVVEGDVRDLKSAQNTVASVLREFGQLNLLVNCAAGNFLCLFEDLSLNAFKTVIDIDLNGTFNMSTACLDAFKSSKEASSIINISATLHYGATPYVGHASAAKAGIDALTRGFAVEWQKYGIRVNGIAPGPIDDTEGMNRLAPAESRKEKTNNTVGPRMGTKDDIAFAAIFLSSHAAKYISGETLVVDGGSWMHKPDMVSREFYEKNIRRPKSKL